MTLYVTKEALQKMVTLQKGYIDTQLSKKAEKFTVGSGLDLTDGVLSVTLDTKLFKVVTELPAAPAAADANKLHLVLNTDGENGNTYTEYIYLGAEEGWEKLGEFKVDVDLTPYLKTADLTSAVTATGFTISKATTELLNVVFSSDFTGTANGKKFTLNLADVTTAKDTGFFKVKIDTKGRVIGVVAVAETDITALGFSTTTAMTQAITTAVAVEQEARETAINAEASARAQADGTLTTGLEALTTRVKAIEDARADEEILSVADAQALYESIYGA